MNYSIHGGGHQKLKAEARKLNGLMIETTHESVTWTDQDYGPMIEHQMNAPLANDLAQLIPDAGDTLAETPIRTLKELFSHPHPPASILRLVKEFAKQLRRNARFAYPEHVATVLYYASIAAAESRSHTAITNLPRQEIRKGYAWSRDQSWIPPELRRLFEEALAKEGHRPCQTASLRPPAKYP